MAYPEPWGWVVQIRDTHIVGKIFVDSNSYILEKRLKIMCDMLNIWVEKIRGSDAEQIVELYHKDALLLGTFSDIERHGKELIFNYFENLLKSKIDVELITQHEHKTDSLIVSSGLYNFKVDGKTIKARFSFVFVKTNESWKILSHHSSELPKVA